MDALSAVSVVESELQKWLVREYLQGVAKGLSVEEGLVGFISIQFSSVAQSCPTLCDPMDCSTPGFPVHHQLSELPQTYVH